MKRIRNELTEYQEILLIDLSLFSRVSKIELRKEMTHNCVVETYPAHITPQHASFTILGEIENASFLEGSISGNIYLETEMYTYV